MKVLRTQKEYERVLARLEEVFGAPAGSPEADERHHLLEQIERYEANHHEPIPPPMVAEALEFHMDQQDLTQADISRMTGISRSHVSEILSGKRSPSKANIRTLHETLGIPLQHLLETEGLVPEPVWNEIDCHIEVSWDAFETDMVCVDADLLLESADYQRAQISRNDQSLCISFGPMALA